MADPNWEFDLDKFEPIEKDAKDLIEKLKGVKEELDDLKANLLDVWVGKGRNQFEKTYKTVTQTLDDHMEGSWDMYEELLKVHEAYIQWDVNTAKLE